jgi:catecholate siderophore receptor
MAKLTWVWASMRKAASMQLCMSTVDGGIVTKGASGYARYDAMMAYQIDKNLSFQLNVYNLGNKVYYTGVRSPHYANMGAGRSAVASLKFTY